VAVIAVAAPTPVVPKAWVAFFRLRITAEHQLPSVGGGEMDVQHLDEGELFQPRARHQARRPHRALFLTD